MSVYNNNRNGNDDDVVVLLTWNSTPFKPTTYHPSELQHLRQSPRDGQGFQYYNPTSGDYERPRSMDVVPRKAVESLLTRSASLRSSGSNSKKTTTTIPYGRKKLPAHLKLHQIFMTPSLG